ncbi:hypothetical protein N0V90_000094 [Kalmusia sp. IMI 367209]|nr:hypothetical protein N0V90_000094 [Kalmusia sp. IMI 367209]
MLRTIRKPRVNEIIERIRAITDLETLLNSIHGANLFSELSLVPETQLRYDFPYSTHMPSHLLEDNEYLESPIYKATFLPVQSRSTPQRLVGITRGGYTEPMVSEEAYNKPFRAAVLVEPLLEQIDLSKWTTVTSDNRLLRRFLEAYFLHVPILAPLFHKDLFLEDLASGGTRLAYKFLAEAKRLWDMEPPGKSRLTTIQAAMVLNMTFNCDAKDLVSKKYLEQACEMAKALDLFGPPQHRTTSKMFKARVITAWALSRLKEKLDGWFTELIKIFEPRKLVFPLHFHLHPSMQYYYWLIKLFEKVALSTELPPDYSLSATPGEICSVAHVYFETLLRLYYIRHGYEILDPWIINFLVTLGSRAQASLNTPPSAAPSRITVEFHRSTFVLAVKGLEEQSKNVFVAKLTVLALKKGIKEEDMYWLQTYTNLKPLSNEEQMLIDENTRCSKVVPIVGTDGIERTRRLGDVVTRVEELSMDED